MKKIKSICLLLMIALMPLSGWANEQKEGEAIDIPEIVLHHLADAYEWHIVSDVSIPLPIIIRSSETGEWHFCTEHSLPDSFFFNPEAHGKIYEHMADGTSVRPLDLSITRNVVQIWIVVAVLLVIFLSCARWYKKHDKTDNAPKGFVGAIELLVMMINDDVIKSSIGEKHYKPYAPYLLTVFFFILVTNLLGQKISFQYSLLPNRLTARNVHTARKNVMLMLPVTFEPPGKMGIRPSRLVTRIKKNTVSR